MCARLDSLKSAALASALAVHTAAFGAEAPDGAARANALIAAGKPAQALALLKPAAATHSPAAHLAMAKAYYALAKQQKDGRENMLKAKGELKLAIRLGRGTDVAKQANQFMMTRLPQQLLSPRTGEGTELIATRLGLRTADRAFGVPAPKARLFEFYAAWCEPCKELEPVMAKIKAQYGDQIDVQAIDVDDTKNADIVDQFDVSPIPTVIYMNQDGKVVGYSIGYAGEETIQKQLQKILPNKN